MAGSRLGEMLVREKQITEEQLKMAVGYQKSTGGRLSAMLVKLGFIGDEQLTSFIAKKQGLQIAELENIVIPLNLVKRVPRKIIEEHNVIPIAFKDGVLTLATSDPTDLDTVEQVQMATNSVIKLALATKASITRAVSQVFAEADAPERKTKEDLLKDLTDSSSGGRSAGKGSDESSHGQMLLRKALIPLLLEKKIITEEELIRKAREIEQKEKQS